MTEATAVVTLAVLLDLLVGDPVYRLHPVRLIGNLVNKLEAVLRQCGWTGTGGGAWLAVAVPTTVLACYVAVRVVALIVSPWAAWAVDMFVLYSCIALRDMAQHASPIAAALDRDDTEAARQGLQRIVGRDVRCLDTAGIARGAVESVAESFVDGFLAPLFWFAVAAIVCGGAADLALPAGVAAALIYRCVNTMDSMVGYRNERYLLFGRAAARADDVLNVLPARLSLAVLSIGAAILGLDAIGGWRVARRDRLKHASPNSAHAESFVAGALHVQLGGPTEYAHGIVNKPWLGDGKAPVGSAHIRRVCRLTLTSGVVATVLAIVGLECAR